MVKISKLFFISCLAGLCSLIAQPVSATQMAITIDDLPVSGPLPPNTTRMEIAQQVLAVLKKHHIQQVYGFINGVNTRYPEDKAVLQAWYDNGQLLGNHTYTHLNANKVAAPVYIKDIRANDPILQKIMGTHDYKYFRYPFLAEGNTPAKRDAIRQYLASQGYKIAPVTVDFADWQYNPPYARCLKRHNQQSIAWLDQSFLQQSMSALRRAQVMSQALFHRDIKQIFLIHLGVADAKLLDRMLTAYEQEGVTFIPLDVAMQDPAYQLTPDFAATKGFTYLYQVQRMKHIPTPKAVGKLYITFPEEKLKALCRA